MQLNFVLKNVGLSISLVQSRDPHMCTLNTTSLVSEPYTDERTRFTATVCYSRAHARHLRAALMRLLRRSLGNNPSEHTLSNGWRITRFATVHPVVRAGTRPHEYDTLQASAKPNESPDMHAVWRVRSLTRLVLRTISELCGDAPCYRTSLVLLHFMNETLATCASQQRAWLPLCDAVDLEIREQGWLRHAERQLRKFLRRRGLCMGDITGWMIENDPELYDD